MISEHSESPSKLDLTTQSETDKVKTNYYTAMDKKKNEPNELQSKQTCGSLALPKKGEAV